MPFAIICNELRALFTLVVFEELQSGRGKPHESFQTRQSDRNGLSLSWISIWNSKRDSSSLRAQNTHESVCGRSSARAASRLRRLSGNSPKLSDSPPGASSQLTGRVKMFAFSYFSHTQLDWGGWNWILKYRRCENRITRRAWDRAEARARVIGASREPIAYH